MIFFKRINIDTISVWIDITSIGSNNANIFGYFDSCKLIFGVFLNVIECLFGNNLCGECVAMLDGKYILFYKML